MYCTPDVSAQKTENQLVQFSGFVMASDSMTGIPYVHIGVRGASRSGTAGADGFFSFPVAEGDTLIFTSIGFYPYTFVVPSGNEDNKFSTIIPLTKHEYPLNTVTIYPWGDKSNFRYAFIHTKIPKDLQEIAEANTNRQLLQAIGRSLPLDPGETTTRTLQYNAVMKSYYGQKFLPMTFYDPLVWAEFIKALKNGDFKKKPEPKLPVNDY